MVIGSGGSGSGSGGGGRTRMRTRTRSEDRSPPQVTPLPLSRGGVSNTGQLLLRVVIAFYAAYNLAVGAYPILQTVVALILGNSATNPSSHMLDEISVVHALLSLQFGLIRLGSACSWKDGWGSRSLRYICASSFAVETTRDYLLRSNDAGGWLGVGVGGVWAAALFVVPPPGNVGGKRLSGKRLSGRSKERGGKLE